MNMPVETLADPLAAHARAMLEHLGEDPRRPGLADTPKRFAGAMRFLTAGYEAEPEDVVGSGIFEAEGDGVVLVRDIEFHSLCEHHMLPFFGSRASSTSTCAACRCRSASPSRSPMR